MLDVINYDFLDLEEFKNNLEEIKDETYDFNLSYWLKEGLNLTRENVKLAENNQQALVHSLTKLAELKAPLIEALDLVNEVKKSTLERVIEYQRFLY